MCHRQNLEYLQHNIVMLNIKTLSETASTKSFQIQRIVNIQIYFTWNYIKQLKMDKVNDNKDSEINAR